MTRGSGGGGREGEGEGEKKAKEKAQEARVDAAAPGEHTVKGEHTHTHAPHGEMIHTRDTCL